MHKSFMQIIMNCKASNTTRYSYDAESCRCWMSGLLLVPTSGSLTDLVVYDDTSAQNIWLQGRPPGLTTPKTCPYIRLNVPPDHDFFGSDVDRYQRVPHRQRNATAQNDTSKPPRRFDRKNNPDNRRKQWAWTRMCKADTRSQTQKAHPCCER